MPSTGIVSPGNTRRVSPCLTCLAGIICSAPDWVSRRAVCGVRCINFLIPALAFDTVSSSKSAPICMIKATSPAAECSPVIMDAMSARETNTSALMSNF